MYLDVLKNIYNTLLLLEIKTAAENQDFIKRTETIRVAAESEALASTTCQHNSAGWLVGGATEN